MLLSWGIAAFLCGHPSFAADKSGVSPNTISLPKGPGSIEGLGESFQPTLNTGTAKYGIRLAVSPGVVGQTPQLALRYEGGGGNGPLGFGWNLALPAIQRRCDEGIPTYGQAVGFPRADTFINDAKEQLVPDANGFFRAKNEDAFIRYRFIPINSEPATLSSFVGHWEATLPDGTRQEYGLSDAGRVQDGTNRIYAWLLERETDTRGNTVLYAYTNFPGDANLRQRYLASIRYGPGGPPWANYHFVTLQYEDRADWFEDCRPGFPVRTGKRLKVIAVGTQGRVLAGHAHGDFDGDGVPDNLVRRYELDYAAYAETNSHWSLLGSMRVVGADGVSALPASTFGYAVREPAVEVSTFGKTIGGLNEPDFVMGTGNTDLADLNGDGLPDILKTEGGQHSVWLNRGETNSAGNRLVRWVGPHPVISSSGDAQLFSLTAEETHLADMDGDGLADLVHRVSGYEAFYFANQARMSWSERKEMSVGADPVPAPFGQPNVRTADLDFDKRVDLIRGDGSKFDVWFNLGDNRYSDQITIMRQDGFDFALASVQIADLNGDRVPDIARIWPTVVEVMAGLGYARFAPLISVIIPDGPLDSTEVERAKLADINGDGLADLVIERGTDGALHYWLNQGNYTFAPRRRVVGLPTPSGTSATTRWADINGNGSTDLIYSDPTGSPKLEAIDLSELINGAPVPNMLTAISNGIGRVTLVGYAPSTKFALEDAAAGQPWPNPVPFPVQVVAAVTNFDSLGHQYVSQFRYHDGYYDPVEKQFRGFARVEQVDLGDVSAPTLVTRSHFDTGRDFEVMKGRLLRLTTEREDGLAFTDQFTAWTVPPVTLYTGTNGVAVHYAHPVSRTNLVKELGQGTERRLESEMEFDNFGNQTRTADYGIVENGNRYAFNDERITTTEYAINTNAWIIHEPMRAQVMDQNGNVTSRAEFFYDDETFSGNNLGQITLGNLTMKRDWIWPGTNSAFVASTRTKYDPYGNPITILDPLAEAPGGAMNFAKGHSREIAYDSRFHTFPVTETIHLGGSSAPLVFQAAYDESFGTVTSSTDFNTNVTSYGYDTFARLINIVRPGDVPAYPTAEYDYALAVPFQGSNLVNYVETRQLDKTPGTAGDHRGHYFISRQFVDGLGRKLLSKHEADALTNGGPPRVSVKEAVTFNQRLKPVRVINPFYSRLDGSLDDQLAYESIEAPGWSGDFALNGQIVTLDLASAHATTSEYDATLREVKTTNPDGTFHRTVYEPLLTRSFDENDTDAASPYADTPMVHQNDGLGRLIRVDELSHLNDDGTPAGTLKTWTTRYEYDLNDQLTHITDSQNNQKWMQYDGLKRKTFMNDPDRGEMRFAYDDASNLTETTDAKNQRISYTYDGANRIRTEDYHDEGQPFSRNFAFNPALPISATNRPDVAYFYDEPVADLDVGDGSAATAANNRGKLAYVWDLSGEEHTSYDARDRVGWVVKRVRDPLHSQLVSFRTGFAYDSLDRLTALTYPDNDALGYQYNDRTLLARITGGPTGSIISNLVYLPSDQQAEIRYGNGVRTGYAYDSRLRLNSLVTAPQASPASPLISFGYEFDGVSNIKSITDNRPGSVVPAGDKRRNTQLFQYDDLYRLTRVQYSSTLPGAAPANNGEINYRYDRIGNMLAQLSTIDHVEKGLPVANLGQMDSGGTAGRWNRAGRSANDPPGPHALTKITPASTNNVHLRLYPYDSNGNMTNLDGMVATWDFKDRLVALENAEMRADYNYDFTDRRITKRVFWKHGEPTTSTNQLSSLKSQPSTTTVTYVGKHFEVREHEAPTKYVFNGNTRVARVTGTFMPANLRVQRLRVATGWNLVSLAVTATNAVQQLSLSPTGGEGEVVQSAFKWRTETRAFAVVSPTETLPAGTVLWVKAASNATLRVLGRYDGPPPSIRAPPEGDFLPGSGLEAWPTSGFSVQPSALTLWSFSPDRQNWQTKFAPPLASFSDFAPVLAVGQAFYGNAPTPVELEQPPGALRLRYYHQDHLGSSSILSDSAGQLVEESANYPFGATRNSNNPRGIREAYQFIEKERDLESALYYIEARFLACSIGRFIRVDPLAHELKPGWLKNPQFLNLYTYCRNQPLSFADTSGLDGWTRFWGGVQAIGGAAEAAGGVMFAVGTSWTGVGAVAGGAVALHGVDTFVAGARAAWTGEKASTLTAQAVTAATGSEFAGEAVDMGIGIAGPGGLSIAAKLTSRAAASVSVIASSVQNVTKASIMRALREAGTVESYATAALIKRGRIALDIVESDPFGKGASGWYHFGTSKITLVTENIGSVRQAAGVAAHEAKHFLQKLTQATYRKSHEFEAYQWQRAADPGFKASDAGIWEHIMSHPIYKNVPE